MGDGRPSGLLTLAVATLSALATSAGPASVNDWGAETWKPRPNEDIPYGFQVKTFDGTYTLDPSKGLGVPLIFHAYLPEDASLRYMWHPENAASRLSFLDELPRNTHVLFVTYGNDSRRDMGAMKAGLQSALRDRGRSEAEILSRLERFHFGLVPMSGISDQGANFFPNLMGHWRSARAVVRSDAPGCPPLHEKQPSHVALRLYLLQEALRFENKLVERLDSAYDWLPWPPPEGGLELIPFGDGCESVTPLNVDKGVALIVRRHKSRCSFVELISRAQAANASGVIVSALEGDDVVQMRCEGAECDLPLRIFATMIPHRAAAALQEAALIKRATEGSTFNVSFESDVGAGYFGAVDGLGRLQEVGWVKFPTLQHMSWAAQWLAYAASLRAKLEEPALVVPIFEHEIMQGEHGISKEVDLPPASNLERYSRVELDFELGCPGTLDADCPIWDHVVQLFVCCEGREECEKCDATPWLMADHHPGDEAEMRWKAAAADGLTFAKKDCGRELGRWMTPFRRRIGRWLTDITPLRGLVRGGKCRFTAQTAPWALPWKPSLGLRFSRDDEEDVSGKVPIQTAKLFQGGVFDSKYNSRYNTIELATPQGASKALLYAVITGHGSDDHNCAEFCPTSHHFRINGHELLVNFTEAGTQWGCTKHVLEGVEPNEHGTWQYGRGGWCDGADVRPWIFDVTDYVSPAGQMSKVGYEGLYRGQNPHPSTAPGYIMMDSSLVFWGHGREFTTTQ